MPIKDWKFKLRKLTEYTVHIPTLKIWEGIWKNEKIILQNQRWLGGSTKLTERYFKWSKAFKWVIKE